MPAAYSPIVRTFCQLRIGLMNALGVARHEVRPSTSLDALLPIGVRREVWAQLRHQGLRLPALEDSERDRRREPWLVVGGTGLLTLYLQTWYAPFFAIPLMLVVSWAGRHRAVHFPLGLRTVGELVIYATPFSEHRDSGYRWTRNEIALKVRMSVAESAGRPLEEIQPDTKLADL